jgi:hypothetical protein
MAGGLQAGAGHGLGRRCQTHGLGNVVAAGIADLPVVVNSRHYGFGVVNPEANFQVGQIDGEAVLVVDAEAEMDLVILALAIMHP